MTLRPEPSIQRAVVRAAALAATAAAATLAAIACGPGTDSTDVPADAAQEKSMASAEATPPAAVPKVAIITEGPVPADPDYEEELDRSGLNTLLWGNTNFSRHTVPYREILSGGPPPDGISSIDDPEFTTLEAAAGWLAPLEPVIAVEIGSDVRAYPLQIMTWHEIVNDEVGGRPVSVTFCPLCNSAIAFDRQLDGVIYDFGTSGLLRNSDLIMYDRQTHSWWQQFTGEAIVGSQAGKLLTMLPAAIMSWQEFQAAYPDGMVLDRPAGGGTGPKQYGSNPYAGYDRVDNPPFLFGGDLDGRLLPKERVVAVSIGGEDIAYPFSLLRKAGVVHDRQGGKDLVVFFEPETLSVLDAAAISESAGVGSAGVFLREVDGRVLTFSAAGGRFIDDQTNSAWNIAGHAIEGPLAGSRLAPVVHGNHFWFAWAAFRPDTRIHGGTGTYGAGWD